MDSPVRAGGLLALLAVALATVIAAHSRVDAPVRAAVASQPGARAVSPPARPRPADQTSRRAAPADRPPTSPEAPLPGTDAVTRILKDACVDCHGKGKPKGGVSVARLLETLTPEAVAADWEHWLAIADRLETRQMPPEDADVFPTDAQRAEVVAWIGAALDRYDRVHAGQPGHVTVRRLTSAEYGYAIEDLTGVRIRVGVDASSDAVGGEGFANFGDVQFVQDASVERYLEAARTVADHAMIGAGPLVFAPDPGRTGLELSALHRIESLYQRHGFRVVSGEGGRPFGFDRYARAFFVAWQYRHRTALGEPDVTLGVLADREGLSRRFATHVHDAVSRTVTTYPARLTVDAWQALPAPSGDRASAVAAARAACEALVTPLVTWPSWFFARGDLAAGGQGDENPLVFDDTTLGAAPRHSWVYPLNRRPARPAARIPGPWTVHLSVDGVHRGGAEAPAVVWRNPRLVLREPPPPPPATPEPAAVARRRVPGPVVSTRPLREVLAAADVERLGFGRGPDALALGDNDFITRAGTSLVIDTPVGEYAAELVVDAELGDDRNAVIRVMLGESAAGPARLPGQRALLGEPGSAGYRAFRAGIDEYLALLPPNSHGAANPADKDPVPPPFDNTYNSPEHDAFVTQVKYQRTDDFFTTAVVDGEDRARLEHAWTDLLGSWPYHDAYLAMLLDHYGVVGGPRTITAMTPSVVATLPVEARPHVQRLRAHHARTRAAFVQAEAGHLRDALTFAARAWRRPLTLAEQTSLRQFYRRMRTTRALDHESALRALLARVLMSPSFLYRVEAAPRFTETRLDDWELASRLSFFLWSSIPDEALRTAAAAGRLRTPEGLAAQVRRMTADPKARRFSTEFFGQWLGFYQFDHYRGVDTGRFPEFTDDVRRAMYDEAIATFEYLVRERRPVSEILHADYTFVNAPLARFYGLDVPDAPAAGLARVSGSAAAGRGGALRLGAVLTTTSAPLRTSPVKRGDWILRRILGTPTPPPPADAGTLPADEASFEGQTLRERLNQHKSRAACASCHLRIDPLGFPLEGFDAVGRVRTTYPDGRPVDVTGEFKDRTTIAGADQLLAYLRTREPAVMTTLARKLIGYALGRTPQASDRQLMRALAAQGADASVADLATTIVSSRQFLTHAGRAVAPAVPSVEPAHPRAPATTPTAAEAGQP